MTMELAHPAVAGPETGTLHCEADGSVLHADETLAGLLGHASAQAMMDDVLSLEQLLADPFDRLRIQGRIEDALAGDETRWLTREGTSIWIRTRVQRVADGQGGTVLRIQAEEATDRRRIEERLRQILDARVLERAASTLAHDINQVLTCAIGHAELIAERLPDSVREEALEDIEALRQSMLDATRMATRLRELTSARSLRPERIDLARFVAEVGRWFGYLFPAGVDVRVPTEHGVPAFADRALLEEALILLLSVIRDRSAAGTLLVVRLLDHASGSAPGASGESVPGTGLMIECRCTGGSDQNEPSSVLEAARLVIQEMGGALDVERMEGVGVRFGIRLPAATDC